jgi:hypothetical protein
MTHPRDVFNARKTTTVACLLYLFTLCRDDREIGGVLRQFSLPIAPRWDVEEPEAFLA